MTATTWNYTECVAALLAAGANTEISTQDGKAALSIAKDNNHAEVIELLEASRKR